MSTTETTSTEEHEHRREYKVIVNGRERTVASDHLTFDEVVRIAFDPVPTDKDITISFRDAAPPKQQGTLLPGESVKVEHNGTTFHVTATDKA